MGNPDDQFFILVDGVAVVSVTTGGQYWMRSLEIPLPAGEHSIEFVSESLLSDGLESAWVDNLSAFLPNLTLIIGILLLVMCALTVPLKGADWTMVLAVDAHLFIFIGILSTGQLTTIIMPLILIGLSTTVWIIGILELRKVLRIWGLVDLIIAIISSFLFLGATILEPTTLFIALILLASELGLVSWLGLSNEDAMTDD